MNRLRVAIHPADEQACGSYRLMFPAQQLADDPNVEVSLGEKIDATCWANDRRVQADTQAQVARLAPVANLAERFPSLKPQWSAEHREIAPPDPVVDVDVDADVVVFQRPLRRVWCETIRVLQSKGIACVVEIDDDFHALPQGHPGRSVWAPMRSPDRNWRWLKEACGLADLVTCTTPALAERYAPHGRSLVLPNCVPEWYLDVERPADDGFAWIGWSGTPITHVGDLDVTGDAVRRVLSETYARFLALGSPATLPALEVDGEFVEWAPMLDRGPHGYARQVARMDVQMVPLADNTFNRAKSALKMIESAALGVVPLVSPSPDNVRMHEQGIGVVASEPDDWYRKLLVLAASPSMRAELAERGREVMRDWTYTRRSHLWGEAWLLAYANRQKARAA